MILDAIINIYFQKDNRERWKKVFLVQLQNIAHNRAQLLDWVQVLFMDFRAMVIFNETSVYLLYSPTAPHFS